MISIAYTAGFIDGEGCITIKKIHKDRLKRSKHDCYQLIVCITNTDIRPLKALKERWGGNLRQLKRYEPHHRLRYFWVLPAKQAMRMLEAIFPYLIVKRAVAEACMKMQRTNLANQYRNNGMLITPEQDAWRAELCEHVRFLNRRGIRSELDDVARGEL